MSFTIDRADLEGWATFLAVAELGGFRAAAARLRVTPSAVSQGIARLERRLDVALFARTTRSVRLTSAGERLLEHARPAARAWTAGLEAARASGNEPRGTLRINAPRAIVARLAEHVVPAFLSAYPDVQVELAGEDRLIDIVRDGFDAGIRFDDRVAPDMIATRLTPPEPYLVVGAPALFAKHDRPRRASELAALPCIGFRRPPGGVEPWRFVREGRAHAVRITPRVIFDDVEACLRAALAGTGLFQFPRTLVAAALAEGALEAVLERETATMPGLSLYHPRGKRSAKLRAFVRITREHLARRR